MINNVFGKDIFSVDDVNAKIVIPVNTQGVMGAGIAKKCKELYPYESEFYIKTCKNRKLVIGGLVLCKSLVFLPTKKRWRDPSKITYVEKGIQKLRYICDIESVTGIHIPALGCGYGKLSWKEVYPLIIKEMENTKNTKVHIYHPEDDYSFMPDPV